MTDIPYRIAAAAERPDALPNVDFAGSSEDRLAGQLDPALTEDMFAASRRFHAMPRA